MSGGGLVETTFFSRTYDDALALVVEVRDYFEDNNGLDRSNNTFGNRLTYDCESFRLTARLTQVMAWLLLQRAIHDGEITRDAARAEEYRLSGSDVCLDNDPDTLALLPENLQELMDRSLKLYQRVARLDEMVARDAT